MKSTSIDIQVPSLDETSQTQDDEQFHTDQVLTIAGGHFIHDTYSAFIPPLLPLLQKQLSTNYALTGGLAIFSQLPSLLNPFLGYLADRISLRYFIILAPIGLTSSYMGLALLLVAAGISIAAFHAPAPAMISRLAGNRIGRGMSLFMAAGELGRTFGPLVIAAGIEWFGLGGIWRLALVGWIVSAILFVRLRAISARPPRAALDKQAGFWPKARRFFPSIVLLVFPRIFMLVALTTYLPIFMSDVAEAGLWMASASLSFLEGAGVVGALLTGTLSDRLGRRRILVALLAISPPLMLLFIHSPSWLAVPLLIALGLTAISPAPVLLAAVQDEFPHHRALANGVYLGMNFLIRAAGVWLLGVFADRFELVPAFTWSAIIALFSLPAIYFLPWKSQKA